jgi:hypothetical protein
MNRKLTEEVDSNGKSFDMYVRNAQFESWPGEQLSWLRVSVLDSPFKLGHDRFVQIHYSLIAVPCDTK